MDYHDALHGLFDTLRQEKGMTWPQIAKQAGMREQFIAGLLRKERNLSVQSLQRLLGRLGFEISFESTPPDENLTSDHLHLLIKP
jgi:transcriptional regulator with XRE-family HTH domain